MAEGQQFLQHHRDLRCSTARREARSFDRLLYELLERKQGLSRELLGPPAATDEDADRLLAGLGGRAA
jgi:hypothetical protein